MILILIFLSCFIKNREIYGSWNSISIENKSSLFAKTLPSSLKGEVSLTLMEDEKFTWINKTEKLSLSGKYRTAGNKLYFNIDGEIKPLEVEFNYYKDKLIIITNDEFKFTFIKTE